MRKELWHCKPRMSRFALLMLICSVAFGCSHVTSAVETAPKRCAILFTGTIARMRTKVDPKYAEKLERMGYQIDARDLNQVDETVLAQFNVVVLYRLPVRGDMRNSQVFKRCIPMLVNYVRNGGGMLIFADLRYEAEKNLNELLREFDAQLLPERIWDENYFRQMRYLQLAFARTRQIAHHPAMIAQPSCRWIWMKADLDE
ncbi:MAG TPA: hypothetical protein EYP10_04495 [Armatimonadetes bacterium]|nr:hypothetical protein [Armatimonadota bacterium]